MRFEEAYVGWNEGRLTQAEAAQMLGMCERSFRVKGARVDLFWRQRNNSSLAPFAFESAVPNPSFARTCAKSRSGR